MKIIPDILAHTKEEYVSRLRQARQLTDSFHIDVIDGKYVDNLTVQPRDMQKQIDTKMYMHLMVEDPVWYARACISLNPHIVIFQIESPGDSLAAVDLTRKNGFRAGVSIDPQTELSTIKPYLDMISHVQVMSYVSGFHGQKYQRKVLARAAEVKAMRADIEIGIDGGVGITNIAAIKKAGFDTASVNSYLFHNPEMDSLTAYSKLLEQSL